MRLHKLVVVMAALAGSVATLNASALGLGEVKLYSTLNQPLMAEIELTQVRELTGNEILSNLASKIDFQRAGIERSFMLSDLNFRTEVGSNGNGLIKVTSSQPVQEPFLNFLVEVHWPSGRLLKEYTLLLDPPAFNGQGMTPVDQAVSDSSYGVTPVTDDPVAPQSSSSNMTADRRDSLPSRSVIQKTESSRSDDPVAPQSSSSNMTADRRDSLPSRSVIQKTESSRSGSEGRLNRQKPSTSFSSPTATRDSSSGPDSYKVNKNDSLWEIARDVRPGRDLSIQQTMVAIQRANPQAFIDDNINRLKTGQVLRIPDRNQIASITVREAINDVSRQNREWSGRSQVAQLDGTRVTAPTSEAKPEAAADGTLAIVTSAGSSGSGQDRGGDSVDNSAEKNAVLQTELAMTREQLDKVSRENSELKSRLQSLDEQIETLERLMVVKEDQLAALQNQAGQQPDESAVGVVTNEPPAPAAPQPELQPEPAPQPEPVPDDFQIGKVGFLSFLLGNPILLAALGVLPFGAAILLFRRRRKKMQEEMEEDDEFYELDLASSTAVTTQQMASQDDQSKFDEALNIDNSVVEDVEDVDSGVTAQQTQDAISEADIYIAYGHLDQAEDLIKQAIAREPGRADLKTKLAEIYAEAGDQAKYDQALSAVRATGDATAIQTAEALGAGFGGGTPAPAPASAAQQDELPDFDLSEFDSDVPDNSSDNSLDFDLDGFGSESEDSSNTVDEFNLDDMDFGLDTESDEAMGQDVEAAFSDDGGSSFEASLDDDIDFMDDGDEVSTKLDLARAYMDMGDMEGAASILQEVIEQGSDEQKQDAMGLLQAAGVS